MNPALVLFPGLGADNRLFQAQRSVFPELVVPKWPAPEPQEPLPRFAARCAELLPRDRDLVLGGASFGGMVALELASLLRPRCVVLIGSCRGPESIAPFLRWLRPAIKTVPTFLYRPRRWWWPLAAPFFGSVTPAQQETLWSMARATPASFLSWGAGAILSWHPSAVVTPVHHIHGSTDSLIPLSRVAPDRVVPGAGHLLTLTHPAEVNSFLRERVTA